jgi:2-polyprenyl-6-methoxyphenol hydroxylase-like FAD-dependent oxidoreductase
MLAARALSEHFRQVTIIERDRLPDGPVFRKGVPQSRQPHALLKKGLMLLEERLPGLSDDLKAAGALSVNWPEDVLWLTPNGWSQRYRSGLHFISASRELLEWSIRRRLVALGKVRFVEETEVTGLAATQDRSRVTGVQLRSRGASGAGEGELCAGLVVDASGRDARTPRWLEALGYAPPRETTINAFLRYTSRYYARPKGLDWKLAFMPGWPPNNPISAALFGIEGDRLLGGVISPKGEYPPTDDVGFLAYARRLPTPFFYEAIKHLEPLTPLVSYQRTENHLRHYDRLERFPEQLLVMGDAVCSFNPVYGQGMTVVAMQGLTLESCLRELRRSRPAGDMTGLSRLFQKEVARCLEPPWKLATLEDLRYPMLEGAKSNLGVRLVHWYFDRILRAAGGDPQLGSTFTRVVHLLSPPSELIRPSILLPTIFGKPGPGLAHPPTSVPPAQWNEPRP